MSVSAKLENLVELAYEVFPAQKLTGLGVCDRGCCMVSSQQKAMAEIDRHAISSQDLSDWYSAAENGIAKNISVHLLPRILRMVVDYEDVWANPELALARGSYGDRMCWIGAQAELLDKFRFHLLESLSVDENQSLMLDDVLCMFSLSRFSLSDSIQQIENWSDESLVGRLWQDWCSGNKVGKIWMTSFWDPSAPSNERLIADAAEIYGWYRGKKQIERIEAIMMSDNFSDLLVKKASHVRAAIAASPKNYQQLISLD